MSYEEQLYVATFRAVYPASHMVEAILIADKIKENGERDLEESDSLDVMQVVSNSLMLTPEESLVVLRRARNICIKTRTTQGFDTAQELNKFIHVMKNRSEGNRGYEFANYDYGDFMDVVRDVLAGGNPVD